MVRAISEFVELAKDAPAAKAAASGRDMPGRALTPLAQNTTPTAGQQSPFFSSFTPLAQKLMRSSSVRKKGCPAVSRLPAHCGPSPVEGCELETSERVVVSSTTHCWNEGGVRAGDQF